MCVPGTRGDFRVAGFSRLGDYLLVIPNRFSTFLRVVLNILILILLLAKGDRRNVDPGLRWRVHYWRIER